MKRNYVALLLGLALTVSSMSVYASEGTTEAATEATTETANAAVSTDESADAEAIVGQVTKVSANSITITKGVLTANDETTKTDAESEADTESTTDAEATTEAAAADTTEADSEAATEVTSSQPSFTLTLTDESLTYNFADDAKLTELAQTEDIEVKEADGAPTAEDATEKASEAVSEEESEAVSEENAEADQEAMTEAASEDATEASEDGTISISTDGIMEGDIVSIQLNSDGTVASLTILAYGTGTVVGGADEATEISLTEADTEAATEAVTE